MYKVMMRYQGGAVEVYDSDLTLQEAREAIQDLREEDAALAKAGVPIQVVEYWKEWEGES